MRRFDKWISLLLLVSILLGTLTAPGDTHARSRTPRRADNDEKEQGLRFRLSEARDQPVAEATTKIVSTTMLSDVETESILARLAPIKAEPADEQTFSLRERSLPPPRTGQPVNVSFPPADSLAPPEIAAGPLEVLRYSPEGAVPLAPNLSITFSQPMTRVTSQEEAAENVPVKLSPQLPGKWRWVGTRTLLFEPEVRFPMATQYLVTVPAGTKSANGGTLTAAKTWSFTTPAPIIKQTYPGGSAKQRRDSLMFIEFDQRIDPATVLKSIHITADVTRIPARLATKQEIESDEKIRKLTQEAEQGRWLVLRALDPKTGEPRLALPGNTIINVFVEPGTSSAEGPLASQERQKFSFITYGPLRLNKSQCGYVATHGCTPYDSWLFEFNNVIKDDQFSHVRVEPQIDNLKIDISGTTLIVEGSKKPNTTYHVTLDKSLQDEFDQTLGTDQTADFKTGPLPSLVSLAAQGLVVLDRNARRELMLYSQNFRQVKISLYSVEPQDWWQFNIYRRLHYSYSSNAVGQKTKLPGRLVSAQQIKLKDTPNTILETPIDLTPALTNGLGQVLVVVETISPVLDPSLTPQLAWVQATMIGLDAFVDNDMLLGWATSLTDGSPLGNVQMQILPARTSERSGADGLARLPLQPASDSTESLLIARLGNDLAFLPESADWWDEETTWHHAPQTDELRWYVLDDRQLYRPGEEVHLKGWLRRVGTGKGGDVGQLSGAVRRLSYSVVDEANNEVGKGELLVNSYGGFDTAFKLPAAMNLGAARIKFESKDDDAKLGGRTFEHSFQVQEFRRPEFEVTAKTERAAPLFVGAGADVSVAANYFAGGGLANAKVSWNVVSRPTNFTPPNRDDYTFGKWTPWWERESDGQESNNQEFSSRTDGNGKHRLHIDFDSVNPPRPSLVMAGANVEDVNRQSWSSSVTLLVHPASLYVGLKSDRTFVQQGEPLVVSAIVTDLDGQAIANREVNLRAVLLDWQQVKGEWQQVETKPQDCAVQSSSAAVKCTFQTREGGTYRVAATVQDDRGRRNESELTLWVAGGKNAPKTDTEEQEAVELIPDRKEYKAGDTAEILALAPFYPAEAVLTLRRSGIIKTERFRFTGSTYTLRVPIEEAWTPNVHLQVDLVGAAPREVPSPESQDPSLRSQGPVGTDRPGTRDVRPGDQLRPAFASGELNLSIPPLSRKLSVSATARDQTLEPGGNTVIDLAAKDASGAPVNDGEVAVVVVDESVLTLINYQLKDPLGVFYAERESETIDYHSRKSVLVTAGVDRFEVPGGVGGGGLMAETVEVSAIDRFSVRGGLVPPPPPPPRVLASEFGMTRESLKIITKGRSEVKPIAMRQNFNALAVFAPAVRTDANGHAQVKVKLPDNLTRYRVLAVAVGGGKQFGTAESAITARLPLMARPSAPRFLNFGDRFELPIVVQNQTNSAITVDLAVRASNAAVSGFNSQVSGRNAVAEELETRNSKRETVTGRRVKVPANDRVEVRIATAASKPGTARFQIAAVSGSWSDAAEIELPVWTPATTESFATYGELDEGAITQPVKAPVNVFPQFGGLEIETSSTQLQQLTDAFLYLQNYPFECSEQLSSRIISVAALRDVLSAFKTKDLPTPEAIEAAVTRDLKRLQGMQNEDGGFGFWQRGNQSWPYLSIHAAHALARARQHKFAVPKQMFEQSQKYLREIESHIPTTYGVAARWAIVGYALYVRAQMGDRDPSRARRLIADAGLETLSLESVGWLLSVLSGDKDAANNEVVAMRRLLANRVTETASTAHFACSYSDGDYLLLNSDRRADGVILEALIGDQPQSDLIPKLVRGLLDHRTRGRWENTQENVFILLALDRYFNTYEKVTPNFVARVWLGSAYAGEQQFKGRTNNRQKVNVPMSYLIDKETGKGSGAGSAQDVILGKDGPGRLYYRIAMNYAPKDLNLKAADYGFTVARSYEALDHPEDVRQAADGIWHIKAGARVRVRLTMIAPARRYHVALVDPLPAGFETLNPLLATTASIPEDKQQAGRGEYGNRSYGTGAWWAWRAVWFDHQNLRDERSEAFAALLWEGVYNYAYVARATTPGAFVVPPAKAEEMYHPETFGRGKTDRVVIE